MTSAELLEYHRVMYGARRMELTLDQEYKAKNIRGFCHLYDGQEAIAVGVEDAFTREDDWITTYRCHVTALVRGSSYTQIFRELFGYAGGVSQGKGGSMHLYNKESNFWGGAAIVGAQTPIGAGLAFAHAYKAKLEAEKNGHDAETTKHRTPVALTMYGDGSANQGQLWEAANMAKLWALPVIFCCENNMYGMGTSVERHTANIDYYTQGNIIPGLFIDGMDVLAVRRGMEFVKEYWAVATALCSWSSRRIDTTATRCDPGITYRTRDEVSDVRASRDLSSL